MYGANAPQLRPIWPQAPQQRILQHRFPLSITAGEGERRVRPISIDMRHCLGNNASMLAMFASILSPTEKQGHVLNAIDEVYS